MLDGEAVQGGSMQFIAGQIAIPDTLAGQVQDLAEAGKTPLLFARGGRMAGIVAVADVIKAESPQAVRELRNMGIRVVMLTGDNPRTAAAIGRQAGVEDVIAGVLPDGKEAVIRALGEKGRVAMVGDGINDAPALTRADIGIAIGAGADVAIDAADVVLMKNRLTDVPAAIRLSRATLRNIRQNLFWAFIYNSIGIPLAAGCFIRLFGWTLNPMFGAAAMSLSSFSVVSNALRLNWFRLYDAGRDRKAEEADISDVLARFRVKDSEAASPPGTELRLEIEGMMCEHCEARVAKALENYLHGVPALDAGADKVEENGNGSLMRIFPFALYCIENDLSEAETCKYISDASRITHAHEISRMSCFIYTEFLRNLIETKNPEMAYGITAGIRYLDYFNSDTVSAHGQLLRPSFAKITDDKIKASGYVVDTLESVIYSIIHSNSYEEAVLTAINMGYDTDTVAGITGSIAGMLYGKDDIPERWLDKLRKKDYLESLALKFEKTLQENKVEK